MEQVTPSEPVGSSRFVDVGTHKLYVVLTDVPSDYTIVLESGGGEYSTANQEIQDTLAQRTGIRVMSYDRSGFGQSELGPDGFDAIDEVDTLKKCLEVQDSRTSSSWSGIHDDMAQMSRGNDDELQEA